jgi:hypothetical protein
MLRLSTIGSMAGPRTEAMHETHKCPICGAAVGHMERYPRQVCAECGSRTRDASGRPVRYFAINLLGGLTATYEDGSRYSGKYCWIDGVRCEAGEHRFGGIVVELADDGGDL